MASSIPALKEGSTPGLVKSRPIGASKRGRHDSGAVGEMCYVFELDGETVWSPALRVGEIFVGFVRVLEETLGISAGLEPISRDMVRIDSSRFETFVRDLLATSTSNADLESELETIVALSWVMLERGGSVTVAADDRAASRAKTLARFMPR